MDEAARLTIDLDALAENFATLRREAAGAEVAPVVKADAYGLGLAPVALRLWAEGARRFFVARASEGAALRCVLGPERAAAIHVLDGCGPGEAADLHGHGLTPCLTSLPQVEAWAAHARRLGRVLTASLQIDTGLNRLGLRVEEAAALAQAIDGLRGIELDLVVSHLACATEPGHPQNVVQAERFAAVAALFPQAKPSLGATAGVFLGRPYRGDVVRPGIGLFGGGPFGAPDPQLRPVATLEAPIVQIRSLPPGEAVGYGATFVADRPMRLAVAAVGYADGVLRAGDARRYGWLSGDRRALVGRISMDLIALDVTGCDAGLGDRVELFGRHIALDDAARTAGSVAYEMLTRIGPRVRRVYLGEVGADEVPS